MHEIESRVTLLGLGLSQIANLEEAYFTGWFHPDTLSPGLVGRIVQWLPVKDLGARRWFAYVCLPSMNSGILPAGSYIDHGSERLTETCSMEDMRRMFVAGLTKLKEIVASEGATNPA